MSDEDPWRDLDMQLRELGHKLIRACGPVLRWLDNRIGVKSWIMDVVNNDE